MSPRRSEPADHPASPGPSDRLHNSERPENQIVKGQVLETRSTKRRFPFWVWLAPLLVGAVWLILFAIRYYPARHSEQGDRAEASRMAMNFVKARFGMGIVLRFAPMDWNNVRHEDNRYVVNGWVEAISRDGVHSATFDYTCDLSRDTSRVWRLAKLDMQVQ